MKFKNITVSGITRVVMNHKVVWTQTEKGWVHSNGHNITLHDGMMEVINHLKEDRRYRMWVHGNTLNVVKVDE
jgi:hypothetical protein